jgi:hypothetical protein
LIIFAHTRFFLLLRFTCSLFAILFFSLLLFVLHRAGLDTYDAIKWDSSGGRGKKGNLTFIPDVKSLFLATTGGDGEKPFERKTDERIQGLKDKHKFKKITGIIPISARHDPNEANELLGRDASIAAEGGGTLGDCVKMSEAGVNVSEGAVCMTIDDHTAIAAVEEEEKSNSAPAFVAAFVAAAVAVGTAVAFEPSSFDEFLSW